MWPPKAINALKQFAVFLFYVFASIIYTWPLARNFSTHIPGGNGDEHTVYWPFWYIPRALFSDYSLVYSNLQVFPDGFRMIYHSNSLVGCLIMAPVSFLFSAAAALNIWLLLQLSLGAFFFFHLCRGSGLKTTAALLGGLLYGYSPFVAAHIGGHFTLINIAWPAGALWALSKILSSGKLTNQTYSKAIGPGFALGIAVWLTVVTDFYLGIMTVFLLTLFMIAHVVESPKHIKSLQVVGSFAVGIVITILLLIPWVVEYYRSNALKDYSSHFPWAGSEYVANLWGSIFPPNKHLIYQLFPVLLEARKGSKIYESTYLGIAALCLLPLFVLAPRKKLTYTLLIGLVIAALLMLGNRYSGSSKIPRWLVIGRFWPEDGMLQQFRVPARWHFAVVTIIAFLAATGLNVFLLRKKRFQVLGFFLAALAAVDLYIGKTHTTSVEPDPWFQKNSLAGPGTLLAFPIGIASGSGGGLGTFVANQIIDQTAHRRPIVSGYIARISNDILPKRNADKEFMALISLQNNAPVADQGLDWHQFLDRYDIKYVQIASDIYGSNLEKLVQNEFRGVLAGTTENFKVYTLPNR